MGIASRLIKIARAYITVTSERLDRVAREVESEAKKADSELSAQDSGRAAREVGAATPTPAYTSRPAQTLSPLATDYRLLGVPEHSDLSVVEDAWRRLAQRADPKRFPAGSPEEKQAAEILVKINAAYARIREAKNPTEGRFGKLEL